MAALSLILRQPSGQHVCRCTGRAGAGGLSKVVTATHQARYVISAAGSSATTPGTWHATHDSHCEKRSATGSLVEAAQNLAQLATPPPGAWESFEATAIQQCGMLHGNEIVRLLHVCMVARRRPRRLLTRLAEEIPEKLPQFDHNGLCVCLHAYAQMRERARRLFTMATRRLIAEDQAVQLAPAHVASLLYSHARVMLSDQSLLRISQKRLVEEAGSFSADDLATVTQALATLRVEDQQVAAACAHASAVRAGDEASLSAFCAILHALTRLGVPCSDLGRAISQRCGAPTKAQSPHAAQEVLRGLTVSELVQLMYGLGDAAWASHVCQAAADILGERLSELDGPKAVVQAMEAFARASQSGSTFTELSERAAARMVDFSVKDVVATANACRIMALANSSNETGDALTAGGRGRSQRSRGRKVPKEKGIYISEALLEALARQALRKGWRFRARHAQAVLDACATCRFEHSVVDELRESVLSRESSGERTRAGHQRKRSSDDDGEEEPDGQVVEDVLEERAFFQEERLKDQDIAAVAAAAVSHGRYGGRRASKVEEPGAFPSNYRQKGDQSSKSTPGNASRAQHPMEALMEGGVEALPRFARPLQQRDEDPSLRQLLRNFDRSVLRPAGLQSETFSERPERAQNRDGMSGTKGRSRARIQRVGASKWADSR